MAEKFIKVAGKFRNILDENGIIADATQIHTNDGSTVADVLSQISSNASNESTKLQETISSISNLETSINTKLNDKVDKETGKFLSTNDYTTEEKTKLDGIEVGAQVNPTKLSELENDLDFVNSAYVSENGGKIDSISFNGDIAEIVNKKVSLTETDPTVPDWAKENTKPSYTAEEVGAYTKTAIDEKFTAEAANRSKDISSALQNDDGSLKYTLKTDFDSTNNQLSTLKTSLETVIGDDTNLSMRETAVDVVSSELIENGKNKYALSSDLESSNSNISALETKTAGFGNETVKEYVDSMDSALQESINSTINNSIDALGLGALSKKDSIEKADLTDALKTEIDSKITSGDVNTKFAAIEDNITDISLNISSIETSLDEKADKTNTASELSAINSELDKLKGSGEGSISSISQDVVNSKITSLNLNSTYANKSTVDNHISDEIVHISAEERTKWNAYESAISTEESRAKGAESNLAAAISTAESNASSYTDSKITRDNLVSIIKEASQTLNGLISSEDKSHLDAMYAVFGQNDDDNDFVNTINEVLSIFENYPEGQNLVVQLNTKISKEDIINALNSEETKKPLSAKQGQVLNNEINILKTSLEASNANIANNSNDISILKDGVSVEGSVDNKIASALTENGSNKYALVKDVYSITDTDSTFLTISEAYNNLLQIGSIEYDNTGYHISGVDYFSTDFTDNGAININDSISFYKKIKDENGSTTKDILIAGLSSDINGNLILSTDYNTINGLFNNSTTIITEKTVTASVDNAVNNISFKTINNESILGSSNINLPINKDLINISLNSGLSNDSTLEFAYEQKYESPISGPTTVLKSNFVKGFNYFVGTDGNYDGIENSLGIGNYANSADFYKHFYKSGNEFIFVDSVVDGGITTGADFLNYNITAYSTGNISSESSFESISTNDFNHKIGIGSDILNNSFGIFDIGLSNKYASSKISHGEGSFNIINSNYSHAEGSSNILDASYSHAEGMYNKIESDSELSISAYGTISSPLTAGVTKYENISGFLFAINGYGYTYNDNSGAWFLDSEFSVITK